MKPKIRIDEKDLKILDHLSAGPSPDTRTHAMFWRILLLKNFKDFVSKIRVRFSIPKDGYSDLNFFIMNTSIFSLRDSKEVRSDKNDVIRLYKEINSYVALNHWLYPYIKKDSYVLKSFVQLIFEYIFWNNIYKTTFHTGGFSIETDPFFSESAILKFSLNSRKDDVTDFIEKNWFQIKEWKRVYNLNSPLKERNKGRKNIKRDILIYNTYIDILNKKISKDEAPAKYTTTNVSNILQKMHSIKMKENTVEKVIKGLNKEIKDLNRYS